MSDTSSGGTKAVTFLKNWSEFRGLVGIAWETVKDAGKAVASPFFNTIDAAVSAKLEGQRFGLTAREYQRLLYAGDHFELSADAINSSLSALASSLYAARKDPKGASAAAAFDMLGIDPSGYASMQRLIEDLAAAFAAYSGIETPALAKELLGSEAMLPLLLVGPRALRQLGDEAEARGIVIDDAAIRTAQGAKNWIQSLRDRYTGAEHRSAIPAIRKVLGDVAEKGDSDSSRRLLQSEKILKPKHRSARGAERGAADVQYLEKQSREPATKPRASAACAVLSQPATTTWGCDVIHAGGVPGQASSCTVSAPLSVQMTINAAQGQSEKEIAEIVNQRLTETWTCWVADAYQAVTR